MLNIQHILKYFETIIVVYTKIVHNESFTNKRVKPNVKPNKKTCLYEAIKLMFIIDPYVYKVLNKINRS